MREVGQLVGIVSMDLSKAFDAIQHPLLLAKLILDDFESTYNNLLDKVNSVSLYNRRIHNM